MWDRFAVVGSKEQQYTEVSLSIDVLRIERNDFAQHRNGELRLLFLKMFLHLLFERPDSLDHILCHQSQVGEQDENRTSHVVTYTTN